MTCRTVRLILTPALSFLVVPFASGAPPAKLPGPACCGKGAFPTMSGPFDQACRVSRHRVALQARLGAGGAAGANGAARMRFHEQKDQGQSA
jgi:hypothetical protein